MKLRFLALIVSSVIILGVLGCGGGGAGGPGGLPLLTRPVSEEQHSIDLLNNLAESNAPSMEVLPGLNTDEAALGGMGSQIEGDADVGFKGRSVGGRRKTSILTIVEAARHFAFQRSSPSRAPSDIDVWTDGWHWTGSDDETDTSWTMSVTGVKDGVGTITFSVSSQGDETSGSGTASLRADLTTTDHQKYLMSMDLQFSGTEDRMSYSVSLRETLDGKLSNSAQMTGEATPTDDAHEVYQFTLAGTQQIAASDGYWVEITYADWAVVTNIYSDNTNVEPSSGRVSMVGSDGFSATLTLNGGVWTGEVRNKNGTIVAQISGSTNLGLWVLSYSGHETTIEFDGGGGGGEPAPIPTANVTGRVVDLFGNGIDGATLSAGVTATTSGGGYYTLPGIPIQTDFSLTINSGGTILTYDGLQVGAPFNGSSSLDIVFTPNASPPGTTISIIPDDTTIATGTTPSFYAVIDQGGATASAAWTVSGADGEINGSFFTLSPGPVGSTVRLRAMVRLSNDQVATAERTLTVINPGGGDEGPPPFPQ